MAGWKETMKVVFCASRFILIGSILSMWNLIQLMMMVSFSWQSIIDYERQQLTMKGSSICYDKVCTIDHIFYIFVYN